MSDYLIGMWHYWSEEKVFTQERGLLNIVNMLSATEQSTLKMANCTLNKFYKKITKTHQKLFEMAYEINVLVNSI